MDDFGLSAKNHGTKDVPYTLEQPSALTALRLAYPKIVAYENALWAASFIGGRREMGMAVFVGPGGALDFQFFFPAYNPETGNYDRLRFPNPKIERIVGPEGYRLALIEHTHPFRFVLSEKCNWGTACYGRGPSGPDHETSVAYPGVLFVIRGAGFRGPGNWPSEEWYYHGSEAHIDVR